MLPVYNRNVSGANAIFRRGEFRTKKIPRAVGMARGCVELPLEGGRVSPVGAVCACLAAVLACCVDGVGGHDG